MVRKVKLVDATGMEKFCIVEVGESLIFPSFIQIAQNGYAFSHKEVVVIEEVVILIQEYAVYVPDFRSMEQVLQETQANIRAKYKEANPEMVAGE
jgi:hypothetical protein